MTLATAMVRYIAFAVPVGTAVATALVAVILAMAVWRR